MVSPTLIPSHTGTGSTRSATVLRQPPKARAGNGCNSRYILQKQVDLLSRCICWWYCDKAHQGISEKRFTSKGRRSWPLEANAAITNWEAIRGPKSKTASVIHRSSISIKINSLMTAHQFFIQKTSQQSTASYTSSKGTVYTCCQSACTTISWNGCKYRLGHNTWL